MEVIILPTVEDVSRVAAAKIAHLVRSKPQAVLGLATGTSPLGIYTELARQRVEGLDFSRVTGFALDEYVGIPVDHEQSYTSVIHTTVTQPLGLDPAHVHVPDGLANDLAGACAAYEAAICASGPVDLQILGIGTNGHIGFNEPSSSLQSRTRIKTLAHQTRADNARFFDSIDDVPTHCLTQGLGTILDARELLLVAQGEAKANAVARAVEGAVTSRVPASILQWHRHATIIVDQRAASALELSSYYREICENKPTWQRWDSQE